MKFKITLTPSNYYQDETKSRYLNPVVIESLDDFKQVILKDYTCAAYRNNHRAKEDFLYDDAIVFDIDNDHSENPDDWFTPNKVAYFFGDVPMLIQYSRNNMKAKKGKPPRPKFHIIMPIETVMDHKIYSAMKEKVYSIFPFVDEKALDTARFLYGTAEPNVDYIDGTRTLTDFPNEYDDNEKRFSELSEIIPEGRHNATMHSIALKLLKRYGLCEESLHKYRESSNKCYPPLEKDELNTIRKSAFKFYQIIKSQKDYIPPEQFNNTSWNELDMDLLDTRTDKNNLIGKFVSDIVLQILSSVSKNE